MGKFITQLTADSMVRINEKPFQRNNEVNSITLELPGIIIALFDKLISHSDLFIQSGLIINVELEAPDIDKAIVHSENVATYALSIMSCGSIASIGQPKPLWSYDASPNLEEREYRLFVYDPILALSTRKIDQSLLFEILEKKFNVFLLNNDIKADRKERVQRAITSFRRGLSDNDDILTEFLIHWSSLETLDVVYREKFNLASQKVYVKCSSCGNIYIKCPTCGKEDIFLKGQTLKGVEEAFALLNQSEKFNLLRRLRTGIIHGFEPLAKSIDTAKNNLELIRKVVLLMIMRILSIDENIQETILAQATLKGKFVPYVKLLISGVFNPVNVRMKIGHPFVEAKCTKIEVLPLEDKITFKPTWSFTPRNCKNMSFRGYEIFGEESTKIEVAADTSK
jgi:hypothetical protein